MIRFFNLDIETHFRRRLIIERKKAPITNESEGRIITLGGNNRNYVYDDFFITNNGSTSTAVIVNVERNYIC